MGPDWRDGDRRRLLDLRRAAGAWGYRATTATAVEPTALAGLALLGTDPEASAVAAGRLATVRGRDGALGVTDGGAKPGWPTPYASLLWAAVGGHEADRAAALGWLLATEGAPIPLAERGPLGHDTTLIGWPWVAGTHSWVEPTALALLALGREGKLDHPRARAGVAVLCDRAIPTGGWNLGNPVVFGTALRPLPGPTGLALLALAQIGGPPAAAVAPAIRYLRSALAGTLARASLGWGLLGLRAWGAAPGAAESWLGRASARAAGRPANVPGLALLLLAGGPRSLDDLGIAPRNEASTDAS